MVWYGDGMVWCGMLVIDVEHPAVTATCALTLMLVSTRVKGILIRLQVQQILFCSGQDSPIGSNRTQAYMYVLALL